MKKGLWCIFFIIFFIIFPLHSFAVNNSIVAVDKAGTVGLYTSLVLDTQGNPIISYYDVTESKLKIAHCFEKNCALFNSIVTPDGAAKVGEYTSIALDNNHLPVVSYFDGQNKALKLLHCGNLSCSAGNTISTVDSVGTVGHYTAVTVDKNNRPVISYYDASNGKLKVAHCGNAACNANNVISVPDLNSSNGVQSSLQLNSLGNPIIAYFDFTQSALKILRCGNANCNAGNIITAVDSVDDVGRYPSLILDMNGNPVVSYLDLTNGKLKILHCGNAICNSGNSIVSIGIGKGLGYFSSLALDKTGNPVVSFFDQTNGDLMILRCGNATCSSNNALFTPDTAGVVGLYTSLKLDSNDDPIVSYFDNTQGDLKVLHCANATCNPNTVVIGDNAVKVGSFSSLKLDANGNPVVSYWDATNGDLKLLHCGNNDCTSGSNISSPDVVGNTGWDTSLALDAAYNPVISFYDFTGKIMKVLHCNNKNCTGVNNPVKPDILSHRHTSIALDSSGFPVIASAGQSDQGLRIVHCGDANCSNNNSMASPDFPAYPFNADVRGVSMVLDINNHPVVSFYRADKGQLKLLHCAGPLCDNNGPANSLVVLDPGAQAGDHRATSVTLDAAGNPVIAYQDTANQALKVVHCGNANCTAGNSIASPVIGPGVGVQPSVRLNASGNPVVSFSTNSGMSLLWCGNPNCTANNIITLIDPLTSGWDSSLAIDANDNPVISYYSSKGQNLKVLHCGTPKCQ